MFKAALAIGALLVPSYGFLHPAGATVKQVPMSIDRTGTQDVTAPLVAFIKSVPNGTTITFPAGSRYRIENIVLIENRSNLVIDGRGAVFFATTTGSGVPPTGPNAVQQHWPRRRSQFMVYQGKNITLRNLTIVGANKNAGTRDSAYVVALEAQAGVDFYATTDSVVENCNISYTYGDFVYIGSSSDHIAVVGCSMSRSGRQGITVAYGHHVWIDGNHIERVRRTAIDLEPYAGWAVTDVWVVRNTFGSVRLDTIAAKAEGDVSNIVIAYNKLVAEPLQVRNTPTATWTGRRHDWLIIGNVSDTTFGSPHAPYWVTETDRVEISDNVQPLQPGRHQIAVDTTGSTRVTLSNNSFPGA
jgi:hypothetical protein